MNRDIKTLMDRLERVRDNRLNRPPADDLSLSLWAFGARLSALDDEGVNAEAEALGISPEAVREMARTYAR